MKKVFTLLTGIFIFISGFSQKDTTGKAKPDTIKIGGMVIIRESGSGNDSENGSRKERILRITKRNRDKPSNVSTNWWIVDLGFSNYNDKTVYGLGTPSAIIAPDSNEDWLNLRTGKSRNVNVWVFMQRLNMVKHIVNLKYGVGLELNNYHFEDKEIRFNKLPTLIDKGYSNLSKNKLAADYLTVPIMLNFNFTPDRKRGFGISAGISAGYLYSSRQKIKQDGNVNKTKGQFDLREWKLSYIGEVALGPVKLYGSYAFKSMFEKGLDQTPFNVGFRISSW